MSSDCLSRARERQYQNGVVARDLIDSLMMFWQLGSPSLHGVGAPPCTQCVQGSPRPPEASRRLLCGAGRSLGGSLRRPPGASS